MRPVLYRGVYLFIIILFIFICIITLIIVLIPMVNTVWGVASYRSKTSPLPDNAVKDLCIKLDLSISDPRCDTENPVYAPEFFDDVIKKLRPDDGRLVTFEDVERLLGKYQYKREPNTIVSDGTEYFVVYYDLRGDRVFPIIVFFYADGRLWRISAAIISD